MDQEVNYWRARTALTPELEKFFDDERKRRQNQDRSDNRNHLTFTGMYAPEPGWDGKDPIFDAVERKLRHQSLVEALLNLPLEDWNVIVKYFFQEKTMEEIGKDLEISKMAVSKRIKNALEKMRRLLNGYAVLFYIVEEHMLMQERCLMCRMLCR